MKNCLFALALIVAPFAVHAQDYQPSSQERQQQQVQQNEDAQRQRNMAADYNTRRSSASAAVGGVVYSTKPGTSGAHPGVFATKAAKAAWRRDAENLKASNKRKREARKQRRANN